MATLSSTAHRVGSVTFVEVLVESERPARVRIETRLDGAVWPPRTAGQPTEQWNQTGVVREVSAGTTGLGFATPAPPRATPVELVSTKPLSYGASGVPGGVRAWLSRLDERVTKAERLEAVDDLPEATAAVAAVGGLAAVETLAADIATDRRATERLSFVPDELRRRIHDVSVPTETFARLVCDSARRDVNGR